MWVIDDFSEPGKVFKIRKGTTNLEIIGNVTVGPKPSGIAFDGTHMWVTNSGDRSVSKIDINLNIENEFLMLVLLPSVLLLMYLYVGN